HECLVIENARRKARAIERPRGAIVIACDTDVVLDGEVLGKPADAAESRAYLDRMSGRGHTVMSGLGVGGSFRWVGCPDSWIYPGAAGGGQHLQRRRPSSRSSLPACARALLALCK